jgi:Flp pilus assembly protein TadG
MFRIWHYARRAWSRFAAERRGSVAVLVGAGIVVLVGFVGVATDTARGYLVKAKLSQALDAAGLAGGKAFSTSNRDADIQMFFDANFPSGFMGAQIVGPIATIDDANQKILLTANATIDTTFMRVLGFEHLTVSSATEVTRENKALDLVLVFDVSGSMNDYVSGQRKIVAARNAATQLVNILFGSNQTSPLLRIGIVPFNSKVNVTYDGSAFNSALTTTHAAPTFVNPITHASQSVLYFANNSPVPLLNAPASSWQGCVYSRFLFDGIATDDADIFLGPYTAPQGSWSGWQPIGPEGEPTASPFTRCTGSVGGQECTKCGVLGITALKDTKSQILDAIDRLDVPDGGTNIPQGLGWGWRVLDQSAPFDEASLGDQTIPRTRAVVLMTDGENCGASGDGYKAVFGLCSAAQPTMDDRLRQLATNLKDSGAYLYTIQFGNAGTQQQQLMRDIASGPGNPYYHYAPSAGELAAAFEEIGNNLSQLRVSR